MPMIRYCATNRWRLAMLGVVVLGASGVCTAGPTGNANGVGTLDVGHSAGQVGTTAYANDGPRQVVTAYLDLAAKGAHLTEQGRANLAHVAGGPAESAESLFTTHVISGYRVGNARVERDTATVAVEFDKVGVITDDFYEFKADRRRTKFDFVLEKKKGDVWEIAFGPAPNMYWETVVAHLETLREVAYDPKHYGLVIQEIRKTARSPLVH